MVHIFRELDPRKGTKKRIRRHHKTARQLERHFKGAANFRRIEILTLLDSRGELTLEQICSLLKCHIATASEHSIRLRHAGLINKSYKGKFVSHRLSPYGRRFIDFIKSFH